MIAMNGCHSPRPSSDFLRGSFLRSHQPNAGCLNVTAVCQCGGEETVCGGQLGAKTEWWL